MSKLLSQDEVDALLKGLDGGEIEAEQAPVETEKAVETFDWSSLVRNVRTTMPLLEVVNTRFGQKFKTSLSNVMRKMFDVTPDPLETVKFSEFQRSLPVPTSMHLFRMEPLRGIGILVIESRLVFSLVEAFFGGSGTGSTKIEGRDLTPIEKRVIEKVVQLGLIDLTESWQDVNPIKTEYIRAETNPLVVNVVPGEEILVCAKFEIELNKPLGNIMLCMPVSSYQAIRHKLTGGYRDEEAKVDQAWVNNMRQGLMQVDVELAVELGQARLSVKEVRNLKKGDILILDGDFKDPLVAAVEGMAKFEGFVGKFNNKKVFRVEQPLFL